MNAASGQAVKVAAPAQAGLGAEPEKITMASGLDFYLAAIQACAPQVQIFQAESIFMIEEGWDSWVLDVRGCTSLQVGPASDMIFRFPRFPEIREAYLKEERLLAGLKGLLPVPVPDFELVHLHDPDPFRCFVAYRKLPGAPLRREDLLSSGHPPVLINQLASFLAALHCIPLDAACQLLGIVQPDLAGSHSLQAWRQHYYDFYAWIKRNAFPVFNQAQVRRSRALWESYLAGHEHFAFKPVLIHADLGPEHILINRLAGRNRQCLQVAAAAQASAILQCLACGPGQPVWLRPRQESTTGPRDGARRGSPGHGRLPPIIRYNMA